ncbi:MAG: ABC transporter permease [Candidatus Thermoplasmatota archaeon]|nr:ABC transporter permease [Candidatus Thermoplasmatota archaeon]
MSALGNIIKKELRELLTPATFLPIIIVALIFGLMGNSIQGIQEEAKEPPVIGVINEDNSPLSDIVNNILCNNSKVVFKSTTVKDKQQGLKTVKQENGVALLIINHNFTNQILNGQKGNIEVYWIMKGAGIMDAISSSVVEYLINTININISKELIQKNVSINASIILEPTTKLETTYLKEREFVGLSPNTLTQMLSSQSMFIPIVMMMIIIMAGGIVITSMALEKENKTLETLLTLPVKRTSIVTGKIVASAIIGLMLAVIYMIGMNYYLQGFQFSEGGAVLAKYNLVLDSQGFIIVGISLFITLIAGLALCMLLGTFTKSYKSAQTLTFPITMLALIPMFITMFADFDTLPFALKVLVYAIPFSHPMMAPRALIFGDYNLVLSGIIYVSIFAIIIINVVVWMFKTDRILTGSTRRKKEKGRTSLINIYKIRRF